jgi:aromatic-L-amino-acid decarboxylase
LAGLIESRSDLELLADVSLNVVCFRYRPADCAEDALNGVNQELLLRLQESGIAVISSTVLEGKFALRAATTNHRSRREDFDTLVQAVLKIGASVATEMRSFGSHSQNNSASA